MSMMKRFLSHLGAGLLSFAALGFALNPSLYAETISLAIPAISVAAGKVVTFSNSIIFAGTDGTTITLPTTNATMARTDAAQTFTGTQTFGGTINAGTSGTIGWTSRSRMETSADGLIDVYNAAKTSFTGFNFGGVTSSFPRLAISGTTGTWKLADNTAGGAFAVPNNPAFLVSRITSTQTLTDGSYTIVDWNSESSDIGNLFDSTTNDEWCPAWTGSVELTVSVVDLGGTYTANTGLDALRIVKGNTGAEATTVADGPIMQPNTTTFVQGSTMTVIDQATSTNCYRVTLLGDTSSGSPTMAVGSFFSGRAF